METTLEIGMEKRYDGICYYTFNLSFGSNSKFFEGCVINGKKLTPLSEAKKFAKENGYNYLKVISMTFGKDDKIYKL